LYLNDRLKPSGAICPTLLLVVASACQAVPPPASFGSPSGLVRAEDVARAEEVAILLEELRPRVASCLPDAECRAREVWVQLVPTLYRFSQTSYAEADGFWSESHGRIHLREDAQSLPRTLAHELVHASLGESWEVLPGTIEEGLCDVVSVLLCPDDSIDMRTGRLSAAAFATGGLELEVELYLPAVPAKGDVQIGCMTRMRLRGDVRPEFRADDVFTIPAGLSSTKLPTNDKKALYGLSYLLVDRIVERVGFIGLHQLCLRAASEGHEELPPGWLLQAAGIDSRTRSAWREALLEAIGPRELRTLLELYPELLVDSASRVFGHSASVRVDESGVAPVAASVRLPGTNTTYDLRLEVAPRTFIPIQSEESQE
jgi:hypothetical protein